jgi:hypothetical protein
MLVQSSFSYLDVCWLRVVILGYDFHIVLKHFNYEFFDQRARRRFQHFNPERYCSSTELLARNAQKYLSQIISTPSTPLILLDLHDQHTRPRPGRDGNDFPQSSIASRSKCTAQVHTHRCGQPETISLPVLTLYRQPLSPQDASVQPKLPIDSIAPGPEFSGATSHPRRRQRKHMVVPGRHIDDGARTDREDLAPRRRTREHALLGTHMAAIV